MCSCKTITLLINRLCKLIYWKRFGSEVYRVNLQTFSIRVIVKKKVYIKMDISLERDGNAIGSLFQQIINDMKVRLFLDNIFLKKWCIIIVIYCSYFAWLLHQTNYQTYCSVIICLVIYKICLLFFHYSSRMFVWIYYEKYITQPITNLLAFVNEKKIVENR